MATDDYVGNNLGLYGGFLLIAVSAFGLCWFLYQVLVIETRNRGLPITRAVLTPVNNLLLGGFVALIFQYIFYVLRVQYGVFTVMGKIAFVGLQTCVALNELLAVYFTWYRTEPILDIVQSSSTSQVKKALNFAPVIYFTQVITSILFVSMNTSADNPAAPIYTIMNNILIGVAGVSTTLFDSIFLYIFIKYLRRNVSDFAPLPPQQSKVFKTVARYGVWSSIFCYCCSATFLLGYTVQDPYISGFLFAVSSFFMAVIVFTLFGMKRAIWSVGGSAANTPKGTAELESRGQTTEESFVSTVGRTFPDTERSSVWSP